MEHRGLEFGARYKVPGLLISLTHVENDFSLQNLAHAIYADNLFSIEKLIKKG